MTFGANLDLRRVPESKSGAKLACVRRAPFVVLATVAVAALVPLATHLRPQSAAAEVTSPGLACETPGMRSWAVKTLGDPNARTVNMTPHPTTVEALAKTRRPAPAVYHIGTRLHGVGTTAFRVVADLVGAQTMADRDVHLVIADPRTGQTMVAEFPDVRCWGAKTSFAEPIMQKARASFLAACGSVDGGYRHLSGRATITGVGFFDRFHRHLVLGTAPNAIELHPVLRFTVGSCTRT